jgi:endonuclease/exonuclease/phosphatase (EEP) superfamily protein YafD
VRTTKVRTTLLISTWLGAAGLIAVLIVRLAGFDYWYPLPQIMAFMPYYVVVGILVVAAFLLQRRWYAVALSGLATIVMSLLVVPRLVDDSSGTPGGVSLRVMSVNLRIGGADAADIAALVKREKVDVIAFQEFTPEAGARLDEVDLSQFSYRSIHPRELALGSAIYSRLPMTDDGVRRHPSGFYQAQGSLDVPGAGEVKVESAHPCAPTGSARSKCWSEDLADQPPAKDGGNAQILLGDFNATLDHAALRKLLGTGYADAASSVGRGLTPTWPYDRPIPRIAIDHVLVNSRISARAFAVYTVGGTDHRCIVADLTIRAS